MIPEDMLNNCLGLVSEITAQSLNDILVIRLSVIIVPTDSEMF